MRVCLYSSCTRASDSTILYAYSTDIDDFTFRTASRRIVFDNTNRRTIYKTYANIRFDTLEEEQIQYHSDYQSFNASIFSRPPNATLGYGNTDKGSDIYRVLRNFLDNPNKAPLCGAFVAIIVKRYPDERAVHISDIISQLRKNHIFVYIVVHDRKSGGYNSDTLFDVAYKTNGYCIFDSGNNFWVSALNILEPNSCIYQFHSKNFAVTGSGRIDVGVFQAPFRPGISYQLLVVHTLQNHSLKYAHLNYTIASLDGNFVFTGPDQGSGWPQFGTGIIAYPRLNGSVEYKWTIDYNYYNTEEKQPQVIETRMYSSIYHDFLPLPEN
ncbi:unnamed protein product [Caenorhabditis nigoni]